MSATPTPAPAFKKEPGRLKRFLIPVLVGVIGIMVWKYWSISVTYAPYQADYATKPDFAQIEHQFPLSPKQLMTIRPENLRTLDQEKVDQIYARLTAGPIPDGSYDGDLFFPNGQSGQKRLGEIVGGLKGVAADLEVQKLTLLGKALWKGKVFYRDQRVLRNRIDDLNAFKDFFPAPEQQKKLDEEQAALKEHPTAENQYFPAKLYCGQSLLDSRRESIIIDYAFTDDLKEYYRPVPDALAGREGLLVRDEIRMVRPGFYLGRAYMAGTFVLNFTLYNKEVADKGSEAFLNNQQMAEDCWVGYQRMAAGNQSGQ
jgi:hypothetical protein